MMLTVQTIWPASKEEHGRAVTTFVKMSAAQMPFVMFMNIARSAANAHKIFLWEIQKRFVFPVRKLKYSHLNCYGIFNARTEMFYRMNIFKYRERL